MATQSQPGKRNDTAALARARQNNQEAITKLRSALIEIDSMRQAMGRPNYDSLLLLTSALSIALTETSSALTEMHNIREAIKAEERAGERIALLEAEVAELRKLVSR